MRRKEEEGRKAKWKKSRAEHRFGHPSAHWLHEVRPSVEMSAKTGRIGGANRGRMHLRWR